MAEPDVRAHPDRNRNGDTLAPRHLFAGGLVLAALVAATVVNLTTDDQVGIWGLLPIVVYAILVLLELDVVLSTGAALTVGLVAANTGIVEFGDLMAESLGSFIAVVGLIVMLGAGLGKVAAETGAASTVVRGLLRRIGMSSPLRAQVGIMLAATVIVGALGTLAGGNAILAPIVIPVAASVSRSRPAVAVMLHTGGAAGLITGPFTPPVVTIMGAANVTYAQYLLSAGLPMAVVVWAVGFAMARVIHRRTQSDQYDDTEAAAADQLGEPEPQEKRSAIGFIGTLVVMAAVGIYLEAGYSYAIVVMLATAIVTALVGGMRPTAALQSFYRGASQLLWLFILFWMFNPLLVIMEESGAYDVVLNAVKPTMQDAGAWPLLMLTLLVGWIGVAGAAVAQVVLIDKLFWPLATHLGVPPGAWAAALLGGSQIDWFGPFPNADMVGQMGLARSSNLRMMLFNGWTVMAATLVMFAGLFFVL